jgi:hydrogenase nickel incorporation protein HypA/HybF
MHEWALAEAVISTILTLAKEKGAKEIAETKIKIGNLQQIEADILTTAFRELVKNTQLEKTEIKLEVEEAYLKCKVCGIEWNFKDAMSTLKGEESEAIHFVPELAHAFIRCPRCGSPDFEVTRGRGIWIEYIKVSK